MVASIAIAIGRWNNAPELPIDGTPSTGLASLRLTAERVSNHHDEDQKIHEEAASRSSREVAQLSQIFADGGADVFDMRGRMNLQEIAPEGWRISFEKTAAVFPLRSRDPIEGLGRQQILLHDLILERQQRRLHLAGARAGFVDLPQCGLDSLDDRLRRVRSDCVVTGALPDRALLRQQFDRRLDLLQFRCKQLSPARDQGARLVPFGRCV